MEASFFFFLKKPLKTSSRLKDIFAHYEPKAQFVTDDKIQLFQAEKHFLL